MSKVNNCDRKFVDFAGQSIYVGLDVHLKSWTVSIMSESMEHRTYQCKPEPREVLDYLESAFPGARYHLVYEAGFSGFSTHEFFTSHGAECMVVHPADVPTKDKERKRKDDKVDARKLCRSLRSNELDPIYVPGVPQQENRTLVRSRFRLSQEQTRCKNRIKSLLYFYSIPIPAEFEEARWTMGFIEWLRNVGFFTEAGGNAMGLLLDQLDYTQKLLKIAEKQIHDQARTPEYLENYKFLLSVPGVGLVTAMTLMTEIGDINRFPDLDSLCNYVGLVPNRWSSGDTETVGPMTRRGNHYLKHVLIEAAWMAIRKDPALMKYYENYKQKKGNGSKAIVYVARKLLNRIRFVLRNKENYVIGVLQ